jgi:hypothetical protein
MSSKTDTTTDERYDRNSTMTNWMPKTSMVKPTGAGYSSGTPEGQYNGEHVAMQAQLKTHCEQYQGEAAIFELLNGKMTALPHMGPAPVRSMVPQIYQDRALTQTRKSTAHVRRRCNIMMGTISNDATNEEIRNLVNERFEQEVQVLKSNTAFYLNSLRNVMPVLLYFFKGQPEIITILKTYDKK